MRSAAADRHPPRLALQVVGALVVSLVLVFLILYVLGSWFANDWNPFNGTGDQVDWSGAARISVPAAGLAAATVAAVLGYHGQMTKVRELENDRDVAVTSRFTEAVGQLADHSLPIRLGGLYALERIAVDSERDREVVGEVLSAFVRESPEVATTRDRVAAVRIASRSHESHWGTVVTFDFAEANLEGLALPAGATLRRCILSGTALNRARVRGVDFIDCDFHGADLRGGDFSDCTFTGCTFSPQTQFDDAAFDRAKFPQSTGLPAWLLTRDGVRRSGYTARP